MAAVVTNHSIKAVRRADTGCTVYIDASAIPTGVKHGQGKCSCLQMRGPEDFDQVVSAIKAFLAEGRVFLEKPSVQVANLMLGLGRMDDGEAEA